MGDAKDRKDDRAAAEVGAARSGCAVEVRDNTAHQMALVIGVAPTTQMAPPRPVFAEHVADLTFPKNIDFITATSINFCQQCPPQQQQTNSSFSSVAPVTSRCGPSERRSGRNYPHLKDRELAPARLFPPFVSNDHVHVHIFLCSAVLLRLSIVSS